MEQRVRVHRARLGGDEVRVIRPVPSPARLVLRDDRHWLSMYADRAGAEQLVALWALAARSARSLVHLPLRAHRVPEGVDGVDDGEGGVDGGGEGEPVSLDLVLLHHSLRFPTASWKEVRARLDAGRPQTTGTPERDFPEEDAVRYERWHHRSYRDHLAFDIAAHTLFVVGSPTAFRERGALLRGLVDEAPSYGHRHPQARHFCVELGAGPWSRPQNRRGVPASLHIQYSPDWRV
ncbi:MULTISPECIES: hypothetical protein [Streptomyces]|uniref:hypothetical protein n=1 Tax=Streptomyces scabiei TaxID=1930 RepID=UPI0004E65164|nr:MULTISPECIES: hypothetical protein [Streptomyces]MBP5868130.1 hypothetical protein [Streptomyces sp. LBUM 1485]KFG08946.1 hypothetical protein IQ61_11130 [Streptomyces scabiei]MBP5892827.1 hypothetical protein [Streptomyces sp. LBUM 1481]MBP5916052.1 hypothetical protein [Streptomyces sp. LBUM 1486]MBP5923093.1 hypothetical protein [Streptomyces sp. LBUM 1483]